jgi:hypothetical protein
MDYSNNNSFIQTQPKSVKVINNILKFYQEWSNKSLDFKQTYISRKVDEQSLILNFFCDAHWNYKENKCWTGMASSLAY